MTPTPPADDLYSLPLDEFTAARDELAKRLRDEGDKEASRAVKALRKPNLPAWAINQLARREGEALGRLLALRDELAEAGDAKELRRLSSERRKTMSLLVERATEILTEAGHSSSASTTEAISQSLQAGDDEEERDRLIRGVLDRPLEPSGFEALGGFEAFASAAEGEPEPAGPSPAERHKAEDLAREAEAAEREAGELATRADEAEDLAASARDSAEKAARRAEKLRRKADEALEALG
ncbi:MAG: hypothetical protein M3198_09000 [Actinomycetota bacterium]|nr:hypothetical protein [Actinomycetota bacterium]